jgi:hypothetical protein
MLPRGGQRITILEQAVRVDLRRQVVRQGDQDKVEPSLDQPRDQRLGQFLAQVDLQAGVARPDHRQGMGQQERPTVGIAPRRKIVTPASASAFARLEIADAGQDIARPLCQVQAHRRHQDGMCGAFGHLHAQARLHLLQARGERRLRDMAQLRRARESSRYRPAPRESASVGASSSVIEKADYQRLVNQFPR